MIELMYYGCLSAIRTSSVRAAGGRATLLAVIFCIVFENSCIPYLYFLYLDARHKLLRHSMQANNRSRRYLAGP